MKNVYAHCDIPCGIYETDTMQHAAATCRRMTELIRGLGDIDTPEKAHTLARLTNTKEVHTERVKHELRVLWGDYFKPEHLLDFPDLHDMIWRTMRQASQVRQTIDIDAADNLIEMVDKVAQVFAATRK